MCIKGKKKKCQKKNYYEWLPKEGKNKTNNIKKIAGQDLFISDKGKDD